ncbi:MAG TPA: ArsI/CadI family heavy metal resistance metalloenzyme [Burkholderiales bacterium]|jgi:catechol 2,3-dioxygenase-like lactoylglutathione lyase family enzyme|nr:ArsI/CadI family heavy metal resistance metalloenzyme [Burkholderiales bacterium]
MKRLHVHVGVHDIEQSVRFYSALFAAEPAVKKADYAKWMLDDPRVNFAISTRGKKGGLDHLGIQAESSQELEEIGSRLAQADVSVLPQKDAACCYAKSDKYWTIDPQGVPWESFHTLDAIPVFGAQTRSQAVEPKKACCGR